MARNPVDDLAWLEGGLEADPTLTDKHGIARMIGVTVKAVDRYVRDGMPIHGERKRGAALEFRVPHCVQWLVRKNANPIEEAKRRQAEAVARKREAEAGRIEGELVEIAAVQKQLATHIAELQNEFMSVAARAGLPPDMAEVVRGEIIRSINKFANAVTPDAITNAT